MFLKTHRFRSHTPAEARRLSNLAHIAGGALLIIVGLLALAGNLSISSWAHAAWQMLLIGAGVLLLVGIYLRHPREDWLLLWNDAQQREHTIMAFAMAVAGAVEIFRGNALTIFAFVFPLAIFLIGFLFLAHKQHGTGAAQTRALWIHRALGITLILSAILRVGDLLIASSVYALMWQLALFAAGVQLIVYREPAGAYEPEQHHLL